MALQWKDRLWLRLFHKVTSGRASIAECNELGVTVEQRHKFYNQRKRKREDAMRKVAVGYVLRDDCLGDDPTDALIDAIDRSKREAKKR